MIMHPLGYFASAPDVTNDALILRDIEDQIGSYAESLTSEDKLAFLTVLSRYLYFKQWVIPDYSIGEAIADSQILADTKPNREAIANTTLAPEEIWDIMLTLEGISQENALGLLQFIIVTEQHCHSSRTPAARTCLNCRPDQLFLTHSESASVIDPGRAWLVRLPKDGFTMPLFSFGQPVKSLSRSASGRIIGMEFVPVGSHYISCGWRYVIALAEPPDFRNWGNSVDSFPEVDLLRTCGDEK